MRLLQLGCIVPLLLVPLLPAAARPQAPLQRFEYRQRAMGVAARIVLYAPDEPTARGAARAAFARVAELDSVMSDYRADSELSRLVARAGGPPVPIGAELFDVLSRAQALARASDGAFDVTLGPLVRLWREARRTGDLPTPEARGEAAARTGWRLLLLDPVARTARLLAPGMQLDLGGIGKGYAADHALSTLRRHGVTRALVELGGDIAAGAPPPGERGWRVRVADAAPGRRSLLLAHAAVSTSGDTEQYVEIGGERYSHVVDPATGLGLRSRVAATVIAPDATTSDALSTLLTVLEPSRGERLLADHFPGVEAHLRRVDLRSGRAGERAPARPGAQRLRPPRRPRKSGRSPACRRPRGVLPD